MGERTGIITFLNIYDEIGDDGHAYSGCFAIIDAEDGGQTYLDSTSDRLIHALETFYVSKSRATVDFSDAALTIPTGTALQKKRLSYTQTRSGVGGPFSLRAIWSNPK
jgi:hypothetical protein